jgi:hypothetical protein
MAEHFLKMEHTPALSEIVNGKGMPEWGVLSGGIKVI